MLVVDHCCMQKLLQKTKKQKKKQKQKENKRTQNAKLYDIPMLALPTLQPRQLLVKQVQIFSFSVQLFQCK